MMTNVQWEYRRKRWKKKFVNDVTRFERFVVNFASEVCDENV
jgi:hypothetical protein